MSYPPSSRIMTVGEAADRTFSKDPDEVLDFGLNWSGRFTETEVVMTSDWTIIPRREGELNVSGDPGQGTAFFEGQLTVIWLKGGKPGVTYALHNRVTTNESRTFDQTVHMEIAER